MELKNGEEPVNASKRSADQSSSAVNDTIELKKQKLENPEEGEVNKISENLDKEHIVSMKSEKLGGEQEADSEGKVESGGEEEEEEDEDSNVKAVIDRKGKGILIEEEVDDENDSEDDSDDDSSDGGNVSENGESDFSDDPLTEVDLDNILPSRTRRRVVHPSAYIATDVGIPEEDSDDSDA